MPEQRVESPGTNHPELKTEAGDAGPGAPGAMGSCVETRLVVPCVSNRAMAVDGTSASRGSHFTSVKSQSLDFPSLKNGGNKENEDLVMGCVLPTLFGVL